ncbi:MAG: hypothetical protein ACQESD_01335 [Thermoplasmatota archaeon]
MNVSSRLRIMYVVLEVEKDKTDVIPDIIADDLISRQTTSVRDGASLGMKEDYTYVMIEGSEEAIEKGKELFSEEDVEEAEDPEEVYEAIKKEDEKAAEGMGTVFG